MSRTVRAGAALALAVGCALAGLVSGTAAAHGGEIDVEIGTDGAGGVSASLVWAGDGHPVEESAVVVVRAVSDDGEEIGPVTLTSASEGVGWYRSEAELLGEGHWTVTARVSEPEKAKVETEVDVVATAAVEPASEDAASADPAPVASDDPEGPLPDDVATADAVTEAAPPQEADTAGVAGWMIWVGAAVVAGGLAVGVVLARRRHN